MGAMVVVSPEFPPLAARLICDAVATATVPSPVLPTKKLLKPRSNCPHPPVGVLLELAAIAPMLVLQEVTPAVREPQNKQQAAMKSGTRVVPMCVYNLSS